MASFFHDGRSTAFGLNGRLRRRGRSRRSVFEEMERRWMLSASAQPDASALAADEAAVGDSIDSFGLSLYAQLQSETGGNLFVSPFSIATALAMTYAGARGETAQQMADVLHLGSDPSALEGDFGKLLNDLNGAGQSGGYLLGVANALWAQQGLALLPEFLNVVQSDFGGGLKQADFIADAEAARKTINDWVAQQTNGKIQDLLPSGSIDELTRLVLTNAIYFKAAWATQFDPNETTDAAFTLASGDQITASTMHRIGGMRYMQSDGFQVVELPYADGRLAMDVLLPTQSGLAGLDSDQLPADLNGWLKGLAEQQVALSLPKFEMTTQFDLKDPLKALGMTDAFSHGADFSGITDAARLNISAVVHKAFISVDEAGTEAAAATAVLMQPLAVLLEPSPINFNVDHPFLFLIRDKQSGSVLFMGQVENPNQPGSDPSAGVITHQTKSQDPIVPINIGQDPVTPPVLPPSDPGGANPPLIGPHQSAPAPLSADARWLDGVYGALLGRAAEPAALIYWSGRLDSGDSRAAVVSSIESSDEFRQVEVASVYERVLGRAADPAGLDYFSSELAAGATVEQIAAEVAGSAEYYQSHGGTNHAVVDALFNTVLGRGPDAAGQSYFDGALAAGETAQQVAAQILASSEYQQRLAGAMLSKLFNHPADSAGADQLAARLHARVADEQAMNELLSSNDFFAQATGGST